MAVSVCVFSGFDTFSQCQGFAEIMLSEMSDTLPTPYQIVFRKSGGFWGFELLAADSEDAEYLTLSLLSLNK